MRVSLVLLIFVWVSFEEVTSKKLWPGFARGQPHSGIPAAADPKYKLSHDLGTGSMFGKLFHLGRKHKGKQKVVEVGPKPSKSTEDFEAVKQAISTLGPKDFAEDVQVVLEKGDNDTSIYRHLPGVKKSSIVFRRVTNDQGKELILLTRAQDHLRIGRTKRTYVVLKQNPEAKDRYFVLYAYIRSNGKGQQKTVEWDIWDARGKTNQKNRPFGWTNCRQSNFVSCKPPADPVINQIPEYEDEDDMEIPDDRNDSESAESSESDNGSSNRVRREAGQMDHIAPFNALVTAAAKILERTMADSKYDYFLDLRDDPVEAKLVGLTVDLVTKGVTTLTVSEQISAASEMFANAHPPINGIEEEKPEILRKVMDAVEASVKNFAGATSVLGLLVGGIENLGKKNATKEVLGDFEAKLGKKFLENILNQKGSQQQITNGVKLNPNPAKLLDPALIQRLSAGSGAQTGRGILGGANEGGLLGNLGSILGLSGLLGNGPKPTTTEAPVKKEKKVVVMGEGISQKALATALVKSAQKEKAKQYANLPDGAVIPEEKVPDEGVALTDMPTGGLAMLGDGDMVHKLPSGGFVLLPKAGGLIHMSAREISKKYGSSEGEKKKGPTVTRAKDPGLLGALTNVVSGLLSNVGTVLKGGGTDEKTGKTKGIISGVGGLVAGLLNDVNVVLNGHAGQGEEEEEVVYEYEDTVAATTRKPKAKGRSFTGRFTPNLETTSNKPFTGPDCVTRRPGIKTWFDPLGLYPDPSDPCYFAPVGVPSYQAIAPAVQADNPYAYAYPFYPYFGRRRKRDVTVPEKTSSTTEKAPASTEKPTTATEKTPTIAAENPPPTEKTTTPTTKEDPTTEIPATTEKSSDNSVPVEKDESQNPKRKKGRGWLFGNGSQKGNGCSGILGVIGSVLGNRKGCDINTDTLTVVGKDGKVIYTKTADGGYTMSKLAIPNSTPLGVPGGPYTVSESISTITLPEGGSTYAVPVQGAALPPYAVPPPYAAPFPSEAPFPSAVAPVVRRSVRSVGTPNIPNPSNNLGFQPEKASNSEKQVGSGIGDESNVPVPVTRYEILARVASQLIHEIAATAVGLASPPPVVIPGKVAVHGRDLIDQALDILRFPPQKGRSLALDDVAKAGLSEPMETDLFSRIGWLTQAYSHTGLNLGSEARKLDIFIGFGTCPYVQMNIKDVTSPEKAIDFYLNLMRTGCHSAEAKKYFMGWVEVGCLKLVSIRNNSALQIQKNCNHLTKPKLSKQELEEFSKTFELAVFSQAYCAELDNKEEYSDGISKTVRTLKDMVILSFKRGRSIAPLHLIKLTRCIVRTVKTAFTKSLQDLIRYQSCSDCTKMDQDGAMADIRALMEVLDYIIADADPSKVDWKTYHKHVDKPVTSTSIDKRLKYYFVH